jgi:hypothetical protein
MRTEKAIYLNSLRSVAEDVARALLFSRQFGIDKGDGMISFSRYAFTAMMRDACFVMLAAGLLMVAFNDDPWLSVDLGASVALLFSIVLVIRAMYLTEERFLRTEAWCALRVEERPRDQALARARLQELQLRFAKNAAGIAGLLYGSALLLSLK